MKLPYNEATFWDMTIHNSGIFLGQTNPRCPLQVETECMRIFTLSNSGRDLVEAYAAQLAAGDAEVLGVLRGIAPYTATTALGGKGRVWNVNIWALPAEQNGQDVSNRYYRVGRPLVPKVLFTFF